MKARILVLAGLILVDVLTTWIGISLGGVEANPAMMDLVGDPLVHLGFKVLVLVAVVAVLELSFRTQEARRYRSRGYCALGSMYFVVLSANLIQIALMALY